jgi:hypothetical protein
MGAGDVWAEAAIARIAMTVARKTDWVIIIY